MQLPVALVHAPAAVLFAVACCCQLQLVPLTLSSVAVACCCYRCCSNWCVVYWSLGGGRCRLFAAPAAPQAPRIHPRQQPHQEQEQQEGGEIAQGGGGPQLSGGGAQRWKRGHRPIGAVEKNERVLHMLLLRLLVFLVLLALLLLLPLDKLLLLVRTTFCWC